MKTICKTACYFSMTLMFVLGAQAQQINTQTAGYNSMHVINTASTILDPTPSRHTRHVYTNDDLTQYAEERQAEARPITVASTTKPVAAIQTSASTPQSKQAADDMKKQASDLKLQISLLQRDIDMDQRELKLRHAYGDSGLLWSNNGDFAQQSQKLHDGIAGKQQQLTTAQQKLDALQDQARKAGVDLK